MLNKAYINLGTLRQNAITVRGKLKNNEKLCAVVKADAYGHGAAECASALYKIADCFAVAIAEEGIGLRQIGIDKEILILTALFKEDLERAVFWGLTPTVADMKGFFMLSAEAARQGRHVRAHIKYDTGMHRQGVDSLRELNAIMRAAHADEYVEISGLYSHFAKPEDEKERKSALDKFLLAIKLVKGYNNKITAHISASGGFLKGDFFDMVRIGILLYGYKPFPSRALAVNPVMEIYAPVLCERMFKKGEKALYGAVPVAREGRYSLIRYGYADGLPRKKCVAQHNNRCMDITAVYNAGGENAYGADDDNVVWVKVLGDADALAREYGTISYEILTKAAIRAEKIYLR